MAPSRSRTSLLSLLAASSLVSLSSCQYECNNVVARGVHFDFSSLSGPHVVHWKEEDLERERMYNYNFTLDFCQNLKQQKGGCHDGARVCAIRENVDLSTHDTTITPIDIAGTYAMKNSLKLDAQFELLRNSKSNLDAARKGLRAALHGGRLPFEDRNGMDQQAIIEFVCDPGRTGLEGDEKDDGKHEGGQEKDGKDKEEPKMLGRRDGDSNGKCEDSDKSLRFCGYDVEETEKGKKVRTLRLEWRTKQACEDASADDSGSHWGFFTWFIIIVFLATATYLIFGSWLNYNRYGARGWDLLPHGDTIRDIPYILKDFGRKVVHTVQGPGSRGGYSAV